MLKLKSITINVENNQFLTEEKITYLIENQTIETVEWFESFYNENSEVHAIKLYFHFKNLYTQKEIQFIKDEFYLVFNE